MTTPADDTNQREVSRRRWMLLSGTVGLSSIAGCLGNGDESDGETGDTDGSPNQNGADAAQSHGVGDEALSRDPEDGWADPHPDVEIPDDPGTAVLHIDGERVEMNLFGSAAERPEGRGTTGAETFEATATGQNTTFRDSGIQLECRRVLGFADTAGVWVESDAITFTRPTDNRRLGNVIYRLFDDGSYADSPAAGDLEGRRFVEESFMRVTTQGVVTVVETLSSHEDDSLSGEFEFGARLQDGWNQ